MYIVININILIQQCIKGSDKFPNIKPTFAPSNHFAGRAGHEHGL